MWSMLKQAETCQECHSWPWSESVLQVLNAIPQFEQQANNKFFHKKGILEVETPVSLNMIYGDEALKNLLCTTGKIKLKCPRITR
jgi:hypothetical protein